jgi:hypothetical protein
MLSGRLAVIAGTLALVLATAGCSATSSAGNARSRHVHNTPATKRVRHTSGLTAAVLAARLRRLDPIGRIEALTAVTDPNHLLGRPGGYTSKAIFTDKRIRGMSLKDGVQAGGSVEVYPARPAALERARYIEKITQAMPAAGSEYDYVSGATLLRIAGQLTPAQAKTYSRALAKVTGLPVTAIS